MNNQNTDQIRYLKLDEIHLEKRFAWRLLGWMTFLVIVVAFIFLMIQFQFFAVELSGGLDGAINGFSNFSR